MKATTAEEVQHYLAHDRSLATGKNLYNRLARKSLALQASFNKMHSSPGNIERICYELAKGVGINERQLIIAMQKPVVAAPEAKLEVVQEPELTSEEKLLALDPEASMEELSVLANQLGIEAGLNKLVVPDFEKGLPGMAAMKQFLNVHDWEHSAKKKADLEAEIQKLKASFENKKVSSLGLAVLQARQNLIVEKTAAMPVEAKEKVRLWQQFPFLREKDCPDVFKILTADMITAYHAYMDAQPKLHDALTDTDRKAIADSVKENFTINKLVWDELEHYQANKQILGAHPIFEKQKEEAEIAALATPDLVKKIEALDRNVKRNTNKSKDEKKSTEDREKSAELAAKQQELLDFANTELEKRK